MKVYGMDIKGKLWIQRISKISYNPWTPSDISRIVYDDDADNIYFAANTEWIRPQSTSDLFNPLQEIIFASTPLPPGWNIKLGVADRMIFVTDNPDLASLTGGSWTISGMNSSGSHNHFAPLGVGYASITGPRGLSDITGWFPVIEHTHNISAGGTHSHAFDGSWRPQYRLVAVGVFDEI